MNNEEVIIIGGGPCGLAAAIALKEVGISALVIEKGNVVDSIRPSLVPVKSWK